MIQMFGECSANLSNVCVRCTVCRKAVPGVTNKSRFGVYQGLGGHFHFKFFGKILRVVSQRAGAFFRWSGGSDFPRHDSKAC